MYKQLSLFDIEPPKISIKPILFNTDMVRAILDDRKTVTRRKIDIDITNQFDVERDGKTVAAYIDQATGDSYDPTQICKYQIGDILYVRETWAFMNCINCDGDYRRPENDPPCYDTQAVEYDDGDSISDGCFIYRADCRTPERITWRPSIHMPKEAARIWLRVTDVRVERIQYIPRDIWTKEGLYFSRECFGWTWKAAPEKCDCCPSPGAAFRRLWDSTIKKSDIGRYDWKSDPWVWVIEFERCKKPESEA